MRRVVISGLGMVSPLGNDAHTTWQNLILGQSGINLIDHFDVSTFPTKFAGLVKNFDGPSAGISHKDSKKMDLFIQYGLAAGLQAFAQSGLEVTEENADRIGVAVGSGIGGLSLIEENHRKFLNAGVRKLSPFFLPINHFKYGGRAFIN
jgi:3-oxoacyl-[acyl-carrier-protein] synthase II